MLYSIFLLFLAGMVLVFFGKVDEVVKAGGIVRANGNVSQVRNVIAGKVTNIYFKPGQEVEEGNVLFTIDSSIYDSRRENLISEREKCLKTLDGLEELLKSYGEKRNCVSPENQVAYSRFESFMTSREKLLVQRNISLSALKNERALPQAMKNLKILNEKELAFSYDEKNLKSFEADFFRSLTQEKDELQLTFSKVEQEINQLDSQYEFLSILAPVRGFVQQLSSLNVGDYLEAGAPVVNLIPSKCESYKVEIQIPPKDMGKISEGLRVKYRLSAFPFFEYRGAEGVIQALDPDIRLAGAGTIAGSGSGGGNLSGGAASGLYYVVYADIDRVNFENRRGESFPIRAGLQTDARIVLKTQPLLTLIMRKMDLIN